MYIEFNGVPIRATRSVNDFINVDMTPEGRIAGIELLALSTFAEDVEAIHEQYDIRSVLAGAKLDPDLSLRGLCMTYARDADAVYIRFNNLAHCRTLFPNLPIIVDLAIDDRPIGIEIAQATKFVGTVHHLLKDYDLRSV